MKFITILYVFDAVFVLGLRGSNDFINSLLIHY